MLRQLFGMKPEQAPQAPVAKDSLAPMRELQERQQQLQQQQVQKRGPGFWQNKGRVCPNEEFYNERIKPREELAKKIIKDSIPGNNSETSEYGHISRSLFLGPNDALKKSCLDKHGLGSVDMCSRIINGIKLQIWDTPNQGRFRTLTSSYYKGAEILIIFAADQNEFNQTKAMIETDVSNIVKNNMIMILAKPQDVKIDIGDFPISGDINITADCKNEKFIQLIYNTLEELAGPDAKPTPVAKQPGKK